MIKEAKGDVRSRVIGVVVMGLMGILLAALILPGLQATRGRRRHEGVNRLRKVSLGYLNNCVQRDDVTKDLVLENGEALHSWETLLLSSLDQGWLYRQIDLERPWDSVVNQDIMKTQVKIFQSPELQDEFAVQAATGFGLSHLSVNSRILGDQSIKTFDDLQQRCSQTLLIGEIREGFLPWGQPGNVRDPAVGLNVPGGFGHPRKSGVLFAFGDGRVQLVDAGVDQTVLETMAMPAGNEF